MRNKKSIKIKHSSIKSKSKISTLLLIIFFFSFIILTTSCGRNPRSGTDYNYLRGTKALVMTFMPNMPPLELYDGDKLSIGLELKNLGTQPITNGKLFIEGYDRNIIKGTGICSGLSDQASLPSSLPLPTSDGCDFEIIGHRTMYNPDGGYLFASFQSDTINLPSGVNIYPVDLTVYACYEYSTKATAVICFDPKPNQPYSEKPCTTHNVMLGSQGAPVAVSSIQVHNTGGNTLRLIINIKNIGGGDLIDRDSLFSKCPTNFMPTDFNVVYANVHFIGSGAGSITCTNIVDGKVRLNQQGYGRIICTAPISAENTAYTRVIGIELSYGYRQFIKKHLNIYSS